MLVDYVTVTDLISTVVQYGRRWNRSMGRGVAELYDELRDQIGTWERDALTY